MTQEILISLANIRYHADNYTPEQIDALEYAAWLDQQNDWSPEEYDLMMSELYANY